MRVSPLLTAGKGPSIYRVGARRMKALSLGGAVEGGWLRHTGTREPSCLLGSIYHGLLGPLRMSDACSAVRN